MDIEYIIHRIPFISRRLDAHLLEVVNGAAVALVAVLFHGQTYVLVGAAILFGLFLRRLRFRRVELRVVSL